MAIHVSGTIALHITIVEVYSKHCGDDLYSKDVCEMVKVAKQGTHQTVHLV
jgi:hypothetical protein